MLGCHWGTLRPNSKTGEIDQAIFRAATHHLVSPHRYGQRVQTANDELVYVSLNIPANSSAETINPVAIVSDGSCEFPDLRVLADLGSDLSLNLESTIKTLTSPLVSVRIHVLEDCPPGHWAQYHPGGLTKAEYEIANDKAGGGNVECTACRLEYYEHGGECFTCKKGMLCDTTATTISKLVLKAGYWRADDKSDKIHKCRFGVTSCPGDGNNQASANATSRRRVAASDAMGPNPYCSTNHVGVLCSACAPDFFLSWTGDGECYECAAGKRHAPTIGLLGVVFAFCVACLACVYKKEKKKALCTTVAARTPTNSRFSRAGEVFALAEFKVFTLFLAFQVGVRCPYRRER